MGVGDVLHPHVCLEKRLIVELDGGQHVQREAYDAQRTQWLEGQGFQVLRFWNHEVLEDWDTVEEVIWRALAGDEKLEGEDKA